MLQACFDTLKILKNLGASLAGGIGALLLISYLVTWSGVPTLSLVAVFVPLVALFNLLFTYGVILVNGFSRAKMIPGVARNLFIARITGFIFTIATSSYYTNVGKFSS
ncbi:MAG: hypothetical protein ACYC7D_12445 [Nitrososphaerales archaeon]